MLGMIFMLIGTIYGFVFYLGPVLWGLFGLIFGIVIGFILDSFVKKFKRKKTIKKSITDVVLLIKCDLEKAEMVEEILSNHHALGMVRV
jgi:uncharacterized protein YqgC (DUF456 family)